MKKLENINGDLLNALLNGDQIVEVALGKEEWDFVVATKTANKKDEIRFRFFRTYKFSDEGLIKFCLASTWKWGTKREVAKAAWDKAFHRD